MADSFQTPKFLQAKILEHEADGIQEYDNPMPFWWSAIFWLTIVFGYFYFGYFVVGVGASAQRDYQSELAVFYQEQFGKLGDIKPTQASILGLAADPKWMKAAQGLFAANCAVCHTADGGGGTGPNLCDNNYINVKKVEDIYKVVSGGLVAKGMPQWSGRFSEPQLVLLSGYVAHLRGTTPAVPKAPQGEPIPPWPAK
ncbi:MAG: c-type cytochrome [Planctomycetes bacterium]|nr:c-type cytochrome [Planctomycetota bacterium]